MNSQCRFNALRRMGVALLSAVGVLSIVASGGGGGNGGGGGGSTYTGNTSAAMIRPTNASTLIGDVIGTGDTSGGVTAASTRLGASGAQQPTSLARALAERLKTHYEVTRNQTKTTRGRVTPASSVDETYSCDFGQGTVHYAGTINDSNGTGTVTATYTNCLIDGLTYNGQLTLRVDVFDLYYFVPTDSTFTYSNLTVTGSGINQSANGTLHDQLNISANTETMTYNLVITDNITGKQAWANNLVFFYTYSSSSYSLRITGRVYDSVHGYVNVSTVKSFLFTSTSQLFPDSGQIILTGAANAHIRVTALSSVLVKVELDLDGDGAYELAATLRWTDLGGPIGADLGDDDGDGMHNSWETSYGLDPMNPADAFVDSDGDGFTNLEEYSGGTDPQNAGSTPPSADVSISKTGPTSALVGQSFGYTLTVINLGPAMAFGVEVTDVLPAGLSLVSVTSSRGACTGSTTLTCALGAVAAGSSVTINLSVMASAEGTYSNTASVTSDTADPNLANNSATGAMTVVTSPIADVTISKTGTTPVPVGDNFAYTITVANVGTATALGVEVTDALPAGLSLVSVTSSQGSCTGSSTVTCDLGTVGVGSNAIINLSVTTSTAGTYVNIANVTSQTPDGNSANNSAMMTTFVGMSSSSIQAQIDTATDGDTIVVAPGIYLGGINFHGKAITVKSEQGPAVTIIDGNGASSVVTFDSGEGNASVLEGFTLQNGFATFESGYEGGGISIHSSSPSIRNNIIANNRGCIGAGIGLNFASAIIQGNVIRNNHTDGCTPGSGGALYIGGSSSAQILDNEISNNSSSEGGAIRLFAAGTPTIRNNVIIGNTGGAIGMVNVSDASIVQNVIANNDSSTCGGVSWLVPSGARGPLLVNNTIVNNDGAQGSAICADGYDAQAEMVNNIIVAKAGQIAVYCGNFNDLNSPIFGFNDVFSPSGAAYGGICADQTGTNGNISADPLFVDASNGDYRLSTGSPAIDAGDNTASDLPATDLAGNGRVLDGNGDSSAVVDMGVYELVP